MGKSMFVSDCLSRMVDPDTCEEDESLNLQVMAITENPRPMYQSFRCQTSIVGRFNINTTR